MSKIWANVSKLLPFSCVDGPGNRLVIFLQGCNFSCLNCHNPYTIGLCRHCGDCTQVCPSGSLALSKNKIIWQSSTCEQCDTCISNCPHQSSPMTFRYSVDHVLHVIRKYLPFLNGITISGGEATLQMPFICALFKAIKSADDLNHLTCFIDSNGHTHLEKWQQIIDVMDGGMIDLKAWDTQVHKRLTSRGNERVIETIRYLALQEKLHEVRLLVIPDQTDLQNNAKNIAAFLTSIQPNIQVRINAFHSHGVVGVAKTWNSATKEQVEIFASELRECGISNVILPSLYLNVN